MSAENTERPWTQEMLDRAKSAWADRPIELAPASGSGHESAIRSLLEEVMWWHSDPTLAEYNGCDTEPCLWCECSKGLLNGTMAADEIVKKIGRPNVPAGSATLSCEKCGQPINCMEEMCIGLNVEILCDDCHERQDAEVSSGAKTP